MPQPQTPQQAQQPSLPIINQLLAALGVRGAGDGTGTAPGPMPALQQLPQANGLFNSLGVIPRLSQQPQAPPEIPQLRLGNLK